MANRVEAAYYCDNNSIAMIEEGELESVMGGSSIASLTKSKRKT